MYIWNKIKFRVGWPLQTVYIYCLCIDAIYSYMVHVNSFLFSHWNAFVVLLQAHIRIWNSISLNTLKVIGLGAFDRAVACIAFSKVVIFKTRVHILCVFKVKFAGGQTKCEFTEKMGAFVTAVREFGSIELNNQNPTRDFLLPARKLCSVCKLLVII